MRRLTDIEKKLRVLKAILNGTTDLNSLRPPQHYTIIQADEGLYSVPGTQLMYDEGMLQRWLKGLRECDTVSILRPAIDCAPLDELAENTGAKMLLPVMDQQHYEDSQQSDDDSFVDYIEVEETHEVTVVDETHTRKTRARKTPVNAKRSALPQHIHEGKLSEYGVNWGSICED
jgi:hypothetical protein